MINQEEMKYRGQFIMVCEELYFAQENNRNLKRAVKYVENQDIKYLIMKNVPLPSEAVIYPLSDAEILADKITEAEISITQITLCNYWKGEALILNLHNGSLEEAKAFFEELDSGPGFYTEINET